MKIYKLIKCAVTYVCNMNYDKLKMFYYDKLKIQYLRIHEK